MSKFIKLRLNGQVETFWSKNPSKYFFFIYVGLDVIGLKICSKEMVVHARWKAVIGQIRPRTWQDILKPKIPGSHCTWQVVIRPNRSREDILGPRI